MIGWIIDIIIAPIQFFWINGILGPGGTEATLAIFGLVEDLIPYVDIIPSCTIAMIYKVAIRGK
jgi:hypothetical protein